MGKTGGGIGTNQYKIQGTSQAKRRTGAAGESGVSLTAVNKDQDGHGRRYLDDEASTVDRVLLRHIPPEVPVTVEDRSDGSQRFTIGSGEVTVETTPATTHTFENGYTHQLPAQAEILDHIAGEPRPVMSCRLGISPALDDHVGVRAAEHYADVASGRDPMTEVGQLLETNRQMAERIPTIFDGEDGGAHQAVEEVDSKLPTDAEARIAIRQAAEQLQPDDPYDPDQAEAYDTALHEVAERIVADRESGRS